MANVYELQKKMFTHNWNRKFWIKVDRFVVIHQKRLNNRIRGNALHELRDVKDCVYDLQAVSPISFVRCHFNSQIALAAQQWPQKFEGYVHERAVNVIIRQVECDIHNIWIVFFFDVCNQENAVLESEISFHRVFVFESIRLPQRTG